MPEEVKALTKELHAVLLELRRVGDRLDRIEGRARTEWRRAWWHRLVSLLLVVIVAAGLLFWRADTIRQCEAANEARADVRVAIVETVLAIAERSEDPERITPVVERIQARLLDTIPSRDCPTGVLP